MESQTISPAVLIALASLLVLLLSSIIGFVVWLVRLEGKATMNAANNARLEAELAAAFKEIETHKDNADIHFNLRVMNQVEKGNEQRFHTIETQLGEINRKLDNMAGRN